MPSPFVSRRVRIIQLPNAIAPGIPAVTARRMRSRTVPGSTSDHRPTAAMMDTPAYRTKAAAAAAIPARIGERGRQIMHASAVMVRAKNSGSLRTSRNWNATAGVTTTATAATAPAARPSAQLTSMNTSATSTSAATPFTTRAAWTGSAPNATGPASTVDNPGGKCVSGSTLSGLSQLSSGTSSFPCDASDLAAATYWTASGSSPGPAGWVQLNTNQHAMAPSRTASGTR